MGIQGLIPFLEKASTPTNVSEFSGKTVTIDAYCWLHKGAFSCADKLARGDACDSYVHYCMKYVNMLLSYRIKPILVFDGQKLPAKADTEKKRRENRDLNRKRAAELMRMDRGKEAQTYLRRCVDITHEMALQLIHACRSRNVDCIVAPYEADAQLAYFNINDVADVIVTEDSDLLLFGAKKVLFKMDMHGNGLLIEQEKLYLAMDVRPENFSFDKFRYMCILSGCDYLPSLPGIGLVKARRFINRTADPDIHRAISRMSAHLNMPQLTITKDYRDGFMAADFMFKYQPVFDPFQRRIVPLNPFPNDDDICEQKFKELLAINGLTEDQICHLAYGNLDPFTLAKLDSWEPGLPSKLQASKSKYSSTSSWNTAAVATHPSIWSENYVPNSWNKPKAKVQSPNALSVAHSSANTSLRNNSTVITKPEIKPSPENVQKAVKELKSLYSSGLPKENHCQDDGESIRNRNHSPDHSKKTHHNPWIKNISKTDTVPPGSKQNVGALSKFASLSKTSTSQSMESCTVISRYFSSGVTPLNESTTSSNSKSEMQTLQTTYSIQNSPERVNSQDSGSFCARSPLKDQNVDDTTLNASPLSPDLNKSMSAIRKRLNPFAVKNPDKKYRAVFPHENNAPVPKKSDSTFRWSEKVENNSVYDITAKSGCTNEFKLPRRLEIENDENVSLNTECHQLTPEQDNEDEGFCSPSIENTPESVISNKSKCRSVGLSKKPSLKQKSLISMFAFKYLLVCIALFLFTAVCLLF